MRPLPSSPLPRPSRRLPHVPSLLHTLLGPALLAPALAPSASAQFQTVTLEAQVDLSAPVPLALADLDGDGVRDAIVASTIGERVFWLERTAGGTVVEHPLPYVLPGVRAVQPVDADGDGDLDLFVGSSQDLRWLENDGAGGFATSHPIDQPFSSHQQSGLHAAAGDLDGDGLEDLLLTTTPNLGGTAHSLHHYRNTGGGFAKVQTLWGSNDLGRSRLVDLDADGRLDVLVAFEGALQTPWFRNDDTGGGTMTLTATGAVPGCPDPLPTDFDGDGDLDLVLAFAGSAYWVENTGGTTFGPLQVLIPSHPVPGNTFVYQGDLADLDQDGDDDLVLSIRPSNTNTLDTKVRTAWYENLGNQTLGPRQDLVALPAGEALIGFALGDVEGDGDVDVLSTLRESTFVADVVLHENVATLGASTCAALPNSSGAAAALAVTGSAHADLENLVLTADGLPLGEFGYFLVSAQGQAPVMPPGSQGLLCLGGAIGRFNGPGQVRNSGASGAFALVVDPFVLPTSTGTTPVLPGQTWRFQGWFRDGTSSNLTDAVSVTFQ